MRSVYGISIVKQDEGSSLADAWGLFALVHGVQVSLCNGFGECPFVLREDVTPQDAPSQADADRAALEQAVADNVIDGAEVHFDGHGYWCNLTRRGSAVWASQCGETYEAALSAAAAHVATLRPVVPEPDEMTVKRVLG